MEVYGHIATMKERHKIRRSHHAEMGENKYRGEKIWALDDITVILNQSTWETQDSPPPPFY